MRAPYISSILLPIRWGPHGSCHPPLPFPLQLSIRTCYCLLTSPHSPFHWRLSEESYELCPLELLIGPGFGRASVNWGVLFLAVCDPKDKKACVSVPVLPENSHLRHLDRDSRDRGCIAYESLFLNQSPLDV